MAEAKSQGWYERIRPQLVYYSAIAAALGVLALIAGGLIYLISPDLRPAARILLGVGALLVVLAIIGAFPQVRDALIARRGRYGLNAIVMVAAFTTILVILNVISVRNYWRYDATATKYFTLAPQTVKVLKELPQPVSVIGFFTPSNTERESVEGLLREYSHYTKNLKYEFVDPEAQPGIARQYEVQQFPSVVFASGDRRYQTQTLNEQSFTTALLIVSGRQFKIVYFLVGHGERDLTKTEDEGYNFAARGLLSDNYFVLTLSLATEDAIPKDAAVLVIAGPTKELLEREKKPIADYLLGGGNILFLLDPKTPQSYKDLVANWGIGLEEGLVVDQFSNAISDPTTPAIQRSQYIFPDITKNVDVTFFPQATAVKVLLNKDDENPPDNLAAAPLAETTFQSWLSRGGQTTNPTYTEGVDVKGPLDIGAVASGTTPLDDRHRKVDATTPPAKIVVIGDSDFATNKYFYSLGNQDLLLNSVNWLAGDVQLIAIRSKPVPARLLSVDQREFRWIQFSSIALLPIIVAIFGLIAWWRRR